MLDDERWRDFDSSGRINFSPADEGKHITLVFAGDWAPIGPHLDALRSEPVAFYSDLLPIFQGATLGVVNLEGVALRNKAAASTILKDGPPVDMPGEIVANLRQLPAQLVTLANNHTMDYHVEGLQDTLALLRELQIQPIGAGLTVDRAREPYYLTVENCRIAIINFAEGEEGVSPDGTAGVAPFDLDYLRKQIADLRANNDVVIAVGHAGRECVLMPPPYVQKAYRSLIEANADLVVGHHPHVPQGLEIHKSGVIAYSLGNFAFWTPEDSPWCVIGYLLTVTISPDKGIQQIEVHPYRIEKERISLLKGNDRQTFLARLSQLSSILNDPAKVQDVWNAYADWWVQHQMQDEITLLSALMLNRAELANAVQFTLRHYPGFFGRLMRRTLTLYRRCAKAKAAHLDADKLKGATILRNRFDTLAHRELYLTALTRVTQNQVGTAPAWAVELIKDWR